MSQEVQFWTTFILALIGALAWIPNIVGFFRRGKIKGKIVSRYNNLNETQTMLLYKVSLFSKNKSFNLKTLSCELEDVNGERTRAVARNNRLVVFTFEEPKRLLVPGDQFLNNYAFFPADTNLVGYLCFHFEGNFDRKLKSTTFILESFDGREKRLVFAESDIQKEQLFFDDTIWQSTTMEELLKHPALKPLKKGI